jgi:hypothetical protein
MPNAVESESALVTFPLESHCPCGKSGQKYRYEVANNKLKPMYNELSFISTIVALI